MKLKSFKYFFGFFIIFSLNQLKSEDKIDIWKNNTNKKQTEIQTNNENKINENLLLKHIYIFVQDVRSLSEILDDY